MGLAGGGREGFEVRASLPTTPGPEPTPPRATVARRELALARQKVRRGMLAAIWVPVAAVVVLGLLMLGFNLHTSYNSALDRPAYDRLRLGEPLSAVEPRLPRYELEDGHLAGRAPANPRGADSCRSYRTDPHDFTPAYRLCFTAGRLTHKDRVDIEP
ncbi:hypothetical protein [Streptomyces sp. NBC_01304]|uniref:hypothetical protein n=1 Tax=Streptomyces sp. NBC_01304 TaxID=2903818 RepID=UPI002E141828|nr:hypothetical protein OG430_23460 [Streptomyces sp. NBC_01304]